jgi:hypothetical protein
MQHAFIGWFFPERVALAAILFPQVDSLSLLVSHQPLQAADYGILYEVFIVFHIHHLLLLCCYTNRKITKNPAHSTMNGKESSNKKR